MSLSKAVGVAIDRAFRSTPKLARFQKLKASGQDLRLFFQETGQSQQQILFSRDKWWSKEGGRLYVDFWCLVPAVQMAVVGVPQSLAAPNYSVPFSHFQYRTMDAERECCWLLHSLSEVESFGVALQEWLPSVALPWLAQFNSTEGIVQFMRHHRQFYKLAIFLASCGDRLGARNCLIDWFQERPRQIDQLLRELEEKGLLAPQDTAFLAKASLQSEVDYRLLLEEWVARG